MNLNTLVSKLLGKVRCNLARQFYVNGEAAIFSGGTPLGVSVDGVSITINEATTEVFVDTRGPRIPGDIQYFLQDVIIKAELVYFDFDELQDWLTGLPNQPPGYGVWGAAGELLYTNEYTFPLTINSTPAGAGLTGQAQCYTFPECYLLDAQETKLGTVRSTWTLTWRSLPPYQPSTTAGQVIFNSDCQ
jgi:hypothetical protein